MRFGVLVACSCLIACSEDPSASLTAIATSAGETQSVDTFDESGTQDDESANEAESGDGDGDGDDATDTSMMETGGDGGDHPPCQTLYATIRDFRGDHPDFEVYEGMGAYTGLVLPQLGTDGTPDLNPMAMAPAGCDCDDPQITSETTFEEWYLDVPDVNIAIPVMLPLDDLGGGMYRYQNDFFFPIDDMGWGMEGFWGTDSMIHNFHFTTEIHTRFTYEAGQIFSFQGDDDFWVFVDEQLVMDLGGVHPPLNRQVNMDDLGLTEGVTYDLDIFHAERHTDQSNFQVETSINCFIPPD